MILRANRPSGWGVLFGLILFSFSLLLADTKVWEASGSIDTDGDGVADRTLRTRGVDTDGDGKADRRDRTFRDDKNNDGDFDDAGETEISSTPISGNATAEIELTDTENNRVTRLLAKDLDGDGKLETWAMGVCDTTSSNPANAPSQIAAAAELCNPERALVGVTADSSYVNVLNRALLPHITFGCEGRKDVSHLTMIQKVNGGIFPSSPVMETAYADLTGDGVPEFSFPNVDKLGGALHWEGPGCYVHPLNDYPDACTFGPIRELGNLTVHDPNLDGFIDGAYLNLDPIDTTYELEFSNTLPVFVPHFGNGGADPSIISSITLDNPSSEEEVFGEVQLRDDDGDPLVTGFEGEGQTSRISFSIPPRGKVDIVSDGQGPLVTGSASIVASGPVGAVERFNITSLGIAGVGAREPQAAVIVPVRREGGLSTGVGYVSAVANQIELTFTLSDATGASQGSTTRDVAGFGHAASFLQELFPQVVADFQGTVIVTTDSGSFAAEALELGTTKGEFTALPVTPVP